MPRPTPTLRASSRATARHASVAGSTPHHQRTADVASGRISHLDKFPEALNRIRALAIRRWQSGQRKAVEQLALFGGNDEFQFQPAEDVINDELGTADLGIAGPTAGLEARVREFATQDLESGTPYWSASDTAVAKESMRPEMVKPCFAMVMKISPGSPSS